MNLWERKISSALNFACNCNITVTSKGSFSKGKELLQLSTVWLTDPPSFPEGTDSWLPGQSGQ